MPSEREQAFGFDAIDADLERHRRMLELSLRHAGVDRRPDDDPAQERSGSEGTVELDAEPLLKLTDIGQRLPDTRPRRAQKDLLLDPIGDDDRHMQPPGCPYYFGVVGKCNSWVAFFHSRPRRKIFLCMSNSGSADRLDNRRPPFPRPAHPQDPLVPAAPA